MIDSAVVGIAGVVAYLREVDASRSGGCALACCAEPAHEGIFCRRHQLDMGAR